MMVMMMATTPSVNASSRAVFMVLMLRAFGRAGHGPAEVRCAQPWC
jgi:hypothetical protein